MLTYPPPSTDQLHLTSACLNTERSPDHLSSSSLQTCRRWRRCCCEGGRMRRRCRYYWCWEATEVDDECKGSEGINVQVTCSCEESHSCNVRGQVRELTVGKALNVSRGGCGSDGQEAGFESDPAWVHSLACCIIYRWNCPATAAHSLWSVQGFSG